MPSYDFADDGTVTDLPAPAASSSWFDGVGTAFKGAVDAITPLATSAIQGYGALQAAKQKQINQSALDDSARYNAPSLGGQAPPWQQFLPWIFGGLALLLGAFLVLKKR